MNQKQAINCVERWAANYTVELQCQYSPVKNRVVWTAKIKSDTWAFTVYGDTLLSVVERLENEWVGR